MKADDNLSFEYNTRLFADQLAAMSPGRALWLPRTDIDVGDVGFFDDGAFASKFNVMSNRLEDDIMYPEFYSLKADIREEAKPAALFHSRSTVVDTSGQVCPHLFVISHY